MVAILAQFGRLVLTRRFSSPSRQPRCERNHWSRSAPPSLILYSSVPLPEERLSSKPNLQSRLKYVHAERRGVKSSRRATSYGFSHSPSASVKRTNVFCFSLL